jgi:D-amino peptidase
VKLFLIADMEGVNTVVDHARQATPGGPLYEECRSVLVEEVNAVARAAEEQGVEKVVAYDTHFYGLNLPPHRLHPRVWPILGKPVDNQMDSSYGGLVLLGFHAMADTPASLLPHTYNLDIKAMHLNGTKVGEIGMEAALAAQAGVPVILVTADSKGVEEARRLMPGVETVTTKHAIDGHSAMCVPAAQSIKDIHAAAGRAIERLRAGKASAGPQFSKSFSLRVQVSRELAIPPDSLPRSCAIRDACTIEFAGDSLKEIWLDCRRTMGI